MLKRTKKKIMQHALESMDPLKLLKLSEKKALKAFEHTASHVSAYRQFLQENNVNLARIKTIEDFKSRVPVIGKENTFKLYSLEIKKLCLAGSIKDVRLIVSSSGHSGCFSYGLNTAKEIARNQQAIDFMLDYVFGVLRKKTLLINGLPMGVKIHSSLVTVVDTSVRPDIVIGIVRTFSRCYDQTIIVGENSFIKKVLEDGLAEGLDWQNKKVHLVLGEEILPENLRSYMADILGINPDEAGCPSLIGSSFGVAEFGLNVFNETKELIRIRRLMLRDKKLREKLIGKDLENLPALLHYNPLRVYVEELPKEDGLSDIVLTNLEEDSSIPLVRYNIKDEGVCLSTKHLEDVLNSSGYKEYIPKAKLPLVAIWGRDKLTLEDGHQVRPEYIKEILYEDKSVAQGITGNFRLSRTKAGLKIEIQMKKGLNLSQEYEERTRTLLLKNLGTLTAEIVIYPYGAFPCGLELNYEKKFKYI